MSDTTCGEGGLIVPRPLVVLLVLVFTGLLVLDVGAQFLPGSTHEASPVLDGALLAILGGVVAASRGPVPDDPPPGPPTGPTPPTSPPPPPPPDPGDGRHRAPEGHP